MSLYRTIGALVCALFATVLSPGAVDAGEVRFGVFVGSNLAAPGRTTLRHAHSDARRIHDVFSELGDVAPGNAVVLSDPSPERILETIRTLGTRAESEPDALMVFYYSGHADERALLLGNRELPIHTLEQALEAFPARLSLHFMDACRSGALTRRKGASIGEPFHVQTTPVGEGHVVIASSAEYEDSQESDRLGGSFFTLHLASALRGAADRDGDARVTLEETYRYVYGRTVESTLGTRAGAQHPTFKYDVRGRGALVLTWANRGGASATLTVATPGEYLVIEAHSGHIVAEVSGSQTVQSIAVRPGAYRIKARRSDGVYEASVDLPVGATSLEQLALSRVEVETEIAQKKGRSDPFIAHAFRMDGGVRGGLDNGISAAPMARISYDLALGDFSLRPHVGFSGGATVVTPRLEYGLTEMTFGGSFVHRWVFDYVWPVAGFVADFVWFRQSEAQDLEPARSSFGGAVGAIAGAESERFHGFYLSLIGELDGYFYRASDVDRAPVEQDELTAVLTYRAFLGLGYEL